MARRQKKEECPAPAPIWLTSWGDMTTLMLTFFVIIIGKPTIENVDMRIILSTFKGTLGMLEGGQTMSKGKMEQMGMSIESLPAPEKGKTLGKALSQATEVFKPEMQAKRISIVQEERGLVISLMGNTHFAPHSARLTSDAKKLLVKVGGLLRSIKSYVRIEGHTDEPPVTRRVSDEHYETDWELASQRAINVLRYLEEFQQVEPSRLSAVSYGKYRPETKSTTPEARSLNRRVDIVILVNKQAQRKYFESDLPKNKVPGVEWQR